MVAEAVEFAMPEVGSPDTSGLLQGRSSAGGAEARSGRCGGGGDRQRDLLPLPVDGEAVRALQQIGVIGSSGAAARAMAALSSEDRWLLKGIKALNFLGGEGQSFGRKGTVSSAQRESLRHLHGLYHAVPPRPEAPLTSALDHMLSTHHGYGSDLAAGNLTSYQRGNLSLPSREAGGVDLLSVSPPDLHEKLMSGRGLLCEAAIGRAAVSSTGPPVATDDKLAQKGYDFSFFFHLRTSEQGHPRDEPSNRRHGRSGRFHGQAERWQTAVDLRYAASQHALPGAATHLVT
jgi:hypothetical protein